MAKAKKLPSGKWRTQVYSHTDLEGKKHYKSFTGETKVESELMANMFLLEKENKQLKEQNKLEMTVDEVIQEYIELSAVLSPTTIDNYDVIRRNAFKHIMNTKIKDMTDITMQQAINIESNRTTAKGSIISPKTVSNEYGLISSAISTICNVTYKVKLPKRARNIKEYPNVSDVFSAIQGTSIELACMLALWLSFSMSEVRGLMCSDVENGIVTINRVKVYTSGGDVIKTVGKADMRIRKHILPPYIKELIENDKIYQDYKKLGKNDYLVPLSKSALSKRFERIMKANNLDISFHKLRHLNASIMLLLNIPSKYATERGGWSTDHVMKTVYQHTFSNERLIVDQKINDYFDEIIKAL